jgi:hypothetical protein
VEAPSDLPSRGYLAQAFEFEVRGGGPRVKELVPVRKALRAGSVPLGHQPCTQLDLGLPPWVLPPLLPSHHLPLSGLALTCLRLTHFTPSLMSDL